MKGNTGYKEKYLFHSCESQGIKIKKDNGVKKKQYAETKRNFK